MANKTLDEFMAENGLIYPKGEGFGLRRNQTTPQFCWHDLLGEISAKATGGTAATLTAWKGNISQYQFGVLDNVNIAYHIPHDWKHHQDCFIHIHWSLTTTDTTSYTFGLEATYAVGHNQAPATANIINTIVATAPGVANQIVVSEIQLTAPVATASLIESELLEPDGMILTQIKLNSKTGGADPFIHHVDIHYKSTGIGTVSKEPDFYT